MKLDIATRALIRLGCEPCEVDRAVAQNLDYLDRPDTLTYSVQFTVTGVKPVESTPIEVGAAQAPQLTHPTS